MGWMQRLLGENEAGHGNAFSVFVGCQRCESHKPVMAAVAEMGPGQSLGHNYIKWWANGMPIRVFFGPGLFAKEIRPRARRFRNPTHVMNCSYGVQLIAAVAAYSWLQLRRAVVGCSCGLLGLFRGSAGSVRSVSQLVPSVRGLRAAIHGLHHYTILAVICPACSRKVSVSVSTPRS